MNHAIHLIQADRLSKIWGPPLGAIGDFDWPGIAIANSIIAQSNVEPWRMSAADYSSAVGRASLHLKGKPVTACWDSALTDAMATAGLAIHEEQILNAFLGDLNNQ